MHHTVGYSAGALTSSVSDLSIYAFALFNGDLFEYGETLELMLQPLAFQDMGMRVGSCLEEGDVTMPSLTALLNARKYG